MPHRETDIEIKTKTDRINAGQIKFHNKMISIGAISEIHLEQKDGSINIIKEIIDERHDIWSSIRKSNR